MIVMREIQLRLAAEAWLERASRRLAEQSHFRLSNPWLNCCLQANALSDQCLPNLTLVLWNALLGSWDGSRKSLGRMTYSSEKRFPRKIGQLAENLAFQIRSSWAQFRRILRFWRVEKSITWVFSIRVNIPPLHYFRPGFRVCTCKPWR